LGVWEPPTAWCDWWPDPELQASAARFAAVSDTRLLGEQFNRGILGDERWERLPERTKELLCSEGAAFRVDMASELTAPFDFADLKAPTVIGYGTATSSGHAEGARRLAAVLGAQLYEVKNGTHFAPTTDPGAWAILVRKATRLAELSG
jgi:pimeloyl-ACP methyl ester carboxylesterase